MQSQFSKIDSNWMNDIKREFNAGLKQFEKWFKNFDQKMQYERNKMVISNAGE